MTLAATRLIPMRKNKGKSIGACLHNHTSYIQNPDKTDQGELVSSYQCSPLTVDEEFLLTKRLYEQTTGRTSTTTLFTIPLPWTEPGNSKISGFPPLRCSG